jgi:outer membrane protein TolC
MFTLHTKPVYLAVALIAFGISSIAASDDEADLRHDYEGKVSQEFSKLATPPELSKYIKSALLNNAGLHAAFNHWKASLEKITQATALPDPELSWMYFVEEVQTRTGPQEFRVSLSQKIPWKGKRLHQGHSVEAQTDSLWWKVESSRLLIIQQVKSHFYDYAYLGQELRIVQENLTLLKSLEPIIQRQVQFGASQSDLIRLQVEIGKLENEHARLEGYRPALSARLKAHFNDRNPEVLPWPNPIQHEPVGISLETLRENIPQINPELRELESQREQAYAHAQHARLERYPDFTVGLTYMNTGHADSTDFGGVIAPFTPRGSGDDPLAITVSVNIPIWKKKYTASENEARIHGASVSKKLHQKKIDLATQLEMYWYELEDADRQIQLYKNTLIPRAEQALELTEVAYEAGKRGILDVMDSLRDVLNFELSYWRFVTHYQKALASIETVTGGELQ